MAINGIDFTDAGVTFDMLNIHLTKCVPECCSREGGQKIIVHGTHLCEVDESILVKFLYEDGRSRIVPVNLYRTLKLVKIPPMVVKKPRLQTKILLVSHV